MIINDNVKINNYRRAVLETVASFPDWKNFITIAYCTPLSPKRAWKMTRSLLKKVASPNRQMFFVKAEGGKYSPSGIQTSNLHFHILAGEPGLRYATLNELEKSLLCSRSEAAKTVGYSNKSGDDIRIDVQEVDYRFNLFDYVTKTRDCADFSAIPGFVGDGSFTYWISPKFRRWWHYSDFSTERSNDAIRLNRLPPNNQ